MAVKDVNVHDGEAHPITSKEAGSARGIHAVIIDASGNQVTSFGSTTSEEAKIVDTGDSANFYIGWAAIGTATSAASWKIQRIGISSGVYTYEWADGNADYDNVFDNRAALAYS